MVAIGQILRPIVSHIGWPTPSTLVKAGSLGGVTWLAFKYVGQLHGLMAELKQQAVYLEIRVNRLELAKRRQNSTIEDVYETITSETEIPSTHSTPNLNRRNRRNTLNRTITKNSLQTLQEDLSNNSHSSSTGADDQTNDKLAIILSYVKIGMEADYKAKKRAWRKAFNTKNIQNKMPQLIIVVKALATAVLQASGVKSELLKTALERWETEWNQASISEATLKIKVKLFRKFFFELPLLFEQLGEEFTYDEVRGLLRKYDSFSEVTVTKDKVWTSSLYRKTARAKVWATEGVGGVLKYEIKRRAERLKGAMTGASPLVMASIDLRTAVGVTLVDIACRHKNSAAGKVFWDEVYTTSLTIKGKGQKIAKSQRFEQIWTRLYAHFNSDGAQEKALQKTFNSIKDWYAELFQKEGEDPKTAIQQLSTKIVEALATKS